jgi:SSS family solute:Na+ symporter
VGVEDYYRKLRPNSTDKERLFMGKIIVAVCGIIAVGVGVFIAQKGEGALKLYYAATAIVSAGLAGMFLLAFMSRRANRQGLWIGITCALIFTAWAVLTSTKGSDGDVLLDLKQFNYTWPSVMLGVIAHVIVLVVGWLTSFLFPPDTNIRSEWTLWGWLAKRKNLPEESSQAPAGAMEVQS